MEGDGVKFVRWGYEVRTSSEPCISAINSYYHQVMSYGRDRCVILDALDHDNNCVLANILAAHFLLSVDPFRASSCLLSAKLHLENATFYEKLVFESINYLISEERDDDVALQLHSKVLKEFPKDLVTLKRAQILCFYMGRPDLSFSLVNQVLPQNEGENYLYGMLAFPLLELGKMRDAEEAAKRGLNINEEDSWSQHALCHVLQYECRFKEAVNFMEKCSPSWSSLSSFMLTHNWWHVALCYLEGSAPNQRVLEVYDNHIWKELDKTDAHGAEVYLNAVGLLLRLYVRGESDLTDNRLKVLAECLTDQANWYLEWHLDVLTVWALAKSGKFSEAADLLKGLKERVSRMNIKKQQSMQRAMRLAEAVYAYGTGNDKHGVELLGPDFDAMDYKIIGASDEQVDVFNDVWFSMLLNAEEAMKAIEAIEKQIKKREGIPLYWRMLACLTLVHDPFCSWFLRTVHTTSSLAEFLNCCYCFLFRLFRRERTNSQTGQKLNMQRRRPRHWRNLISTKGTSNNYIVSVSCTNATSCFVACSGNQVCKIRQCVRSIRLNLVYHVEVI